MPDINFNDTYDELSNLAIDPAEMKADEEPKKAKDLKFLEEVKKILTAKYGDVFTTAKKAEAEGLRIIDRTFTIDRPRTINLPEIEEAASLIDERLLGAFANTRDLVYKIYIYYWPTGNEYHVELYGDDACFKYYGLAGYRNYYQGYENKPEGFIKDREEKRAYYQQLLDNIDAETERKKQSLQRSIDQETEWINFMKAHTKGYEAEVKEAPTEALKNNTDIKQPLQEAFSFTDKILEKVLRRLVKLLNNDEYTSDCVSDIFDKVLDAIETYLQKRGKTPNDYLKDNAAITDAKLAAGKSFVFNKVSMIDACKEAIKQYIIKDNYHNVVDATH